MRLATFSLGSLLSATAMVLAALGAASACSDTAGAKATPVADEAGADGSDTFSGSEALNVDVSKGRVYVKLANPPALVTPADPKTDKTWDLAFEGLDVFTNSGPSGPGGGSAFGPLDPIAFIDSVAPAVPFLSPDTTGGAFIRWWYYGGAAADHALYTRFHIYGVQDGTHFYKVQVLNYYGVREGAPVAALYRVRWAEVTSAGSGPTKDVADLDGTVGGTTNAPDQKGECLDLGTGARVMLLPTESRTSSAWHLCFRRENISVNGEVGGPRGVGAVDLDAAKSATEMLVDVVNKTPESEQPRFDAIAMAALSGQPYRGDRIVSAFGTLWLDHTGSVAAPAKMAWLVVGADSKANYLVGFSSFMSATATNPGTISMRVKPVTVAP
jgi:hypothetical protein